MLIERHAALRHVSTDKPCARWCFWFEKLLANPGVDLEVQIENDSPYAYISQVCAHTATHWSNALTSFVSSNMPTPDGLW